MADLRAGECPLGVDGIGQAAQPGNRVVFHHECVTLHPTARADCTVGDRGHRRAAGGDASVELDEFVGDSAVAHHPFERRGLDDAVPQRERPQCRRCERVGDGGSGSPDGRARH